MDVHIVAEHVVSEYNIRIGDVVIRAVVTIANI